MKFKILLFILFVNSSIYAQIEDAWVYFTDKPDEAYYLANPIEMLTQRALDRRTNQNIALDSRDIPISQAYINSITAANGITVMAKSKWLNALHIRGLQSDIQALVSLSFVDSVDFANHALNPGGRISSSNRVGKVQDKFETQANFNYGNSSNQVQMLNAHLLHQQNYTGQGKIVAILDGGFPAVDVIAPFQRLRDNNLILGGYNFPDRSDVIYTRHNHGTNVLSTMAGYVDGQLVGTAPDAQYYLFITEDVNSENPVEESYWVEAAELADYYGVDVINSSLGYWDYDNANYSYTYAMRNGQVGFASRGASIAFEKGIVCVISAGNDGNGSEPHIAIPADAENILAVGAVSNTEAYASFSSIGPSADGRIKPDVAAMGLNATISNTSGNINSASGTSFASPILAGAVTSFWSAVPNLTAAQVIQFVKESADQYSSPDNLKGYGIPDFQLALNNALNTQNFIQNEVVLYPNPVKTNITILRNNTEQGSFVLYNHLGQKVLDFIVPQNQENISLSELSSGVYFYDFSSNSGKLRGKLIKQ